MKEKTYPTEYHINKEEETIWIEQTNVNGFTRIILTSRQVDNLYKKYCEGLRK